MCLRWVRIVSRAYRQLAGQVVGGAAFGSQQEDLALASGEGEAGARPGFGLGRAGREAGRSAGQIVAHHHLAAPDPFERIDQDVRWHRLQQVALHAHPQRLQHMAIGPRVGEDHHPERWILRQQHGRRLQAAVLTGEGVEQQHVDRLGVGRQRHDVRVAGDPVDHLHRGSERREHGPQAADHQLAVVGQTDPQCHAALASHPGTHDTGTVGRTVGPDRRSCITRPGDARDPPSPYARTSVSGRARSRAQTTVRPTVRASEQGDR